MWLYPSIMLPIPPTFTHASPCIRFPQSCILHPHTPTSLTHIPASRMTPIIFRTHTPALPPSPVSISHPDTIINTAHPRSPHICTHHDSSHTHTPAHCTYTPPHHPRPEPTAVRRRPPLPHIHPNAWGVGVGTIIRTGSIYCNIKA